MIVLYLVLCSLVLCLAGFLAIGYIFILKPYIQSRKDKDSIVDVEIFPKQLIDKYFSQMQYVIERSRDMNEMFAYFRYFFLIIANYIEKEHQVDRKELANMMLGYLAIFFNQVAITGGYRGQDISDHGNPLEILFSNTIDDDMASTENKSVGLYF